MAEVTGEAIIIEEFVTEGMELEGSYCTTADRGEDDAEYFVLVKWLHTCNESDAVNEVGLFGNKNSIAQPRTPKWEHTVNRLKSIWKIK